MKGELTESGLKGLGVQLCGHKPEIKSSTCANAKITAFRYYKSKTRLFSSQLLSSAGLIRKMPPEKGFMQWGNVVWMVGERRERAIYSLASIAPLIAKKVLNTQFQAVACSFASFFS